jgi:hypothetical protein
MTLTAPAPALPLFGTVAYEPALEPPAPDGPPLDGWVVEGDLPPADERGGTTGGYEAAVPDGPAVGDAAVLDGPAVGDAAVLGGPAAGGAAVLDGPAVGGAAVLGGPAAATRPEAVGGLTLAPNGSGGRTGARVMGPTDGQLRRERERAIAARRRAELVVRTALEVLDGRRPVRQLAPFVAPAVLRYVNAGIPRRGHGAASGASLRSLHVSLPGRTAAEVAAVCRVGTRVRALAARLELTGQGEWRCVALRVI